MVICCWSCLVKITLLISLCLFHYVDVTLLMLIYRYNSVGVTLLMSLCWCQSVDEKICDWATFQLWEWCQVHLEIWQKQLSPSCQRHPHEASKPVILQQLVVPTMQALQGSMQFSDNSYCFGGRALTFFWILVN